MGTDFDWKCLNKFVGDDDFICHIDKHTLRVEQMDDNLWWWAIYFPDDSDEMGYADSEESAKEMAEDLYKKSL